MRGQSRETRAGRPRSLLERFRGELGRGVHPSLAKRKVTDALLRRHDPWSVARHRDWIDRILEREERRLLRDAGRPADRPSLAPAGSGNP